MLTPTPFELGLIVMGNNSVAFDAVCSAIIGVDAKTVDHIRLAHEYGFGPIDLDDIRITGDVTLDEAKKKAAGFKVGLVRVEKYFEGTNITAYAGPPPEPERTDYCWGGCPGAMEEAIEILRLFDKQLDDKMPRIHIVFGAYDGPIDAKPGEQVVFIGDCARWQGTIADKLVSIESLYKDRSTKDPHRAKHDDIYAKLVSTTAKFAMAKKDVPVRLTGCPVSVAEQVLALVSLAGANNPFFAPSEAARFNKSYLMWRSVTMAQRLRGQPYQKNGTFAERGNAAPHIEAPADAE